jgi:hypothetical protein
LAYSQFHEGFWTDPEIRKLSPDEKLIFTWFITNPSRHYSGLYFFEFENIGKQTGLSEKSVRKGIDTLSASGFIQYNQKYSMVWVKKMARHEIRRSEKSGLYSEKQTKGVANHFQTLHNCPLIGDFLSYYPEMKIPYRYPIRQEEEKEEIKKEEESPPSIPSKKSVKKTKTPLPEDFQISERVREWALKNNFNHLQKHLEAFKLRAQARGYTYVDWDAAFMTAIREDWGKIRGNGGSQPAEPVLPQKRHNPSCPRCRGSGNYQYGTMPDNSPAYKTCDCEASDG